MYTTENTYKHIVPMLTARECIILKNIQEPTGVRNENDLQLKSRSLSQDR